MIRELLAHKDYVRVLNALELHPPQVTRALKFLCETKLVASELANTATGSRIAARRSKRPYALLSRPSIGGGLGSVPMLSSICGSGGPKGSAKPCRLLFTEP